MAYRAIDLPSWKYLHQQVSLNGMVTRKRRPSREHPTVRKSMKYLHRTDYHHFLPSTRTWITGHYKLCLSSIVLAHSRDVTAPGIAEMNLLPQLEIKLTSIRRRSSTEPSLNQSHHIFMRIPLAFCWSLRGGKKGSQLSPRRAFSGCSIALKRYCLSP